MVARPFRSRLFFFLLVIAVLSGVSTAAYSQEESILRVVPKNALICLRLTNLWEFDDKVADLLDSLDIPDVPETSIAPLLGQLVGASIGSMQDLELAGFDIEGDAYIFWMALSPDKFSIAAHVKYRQQAEEAISTRMSGVQKQHRGVPYVVSKSSFAWAFLGDVFVYSKDEKFVMEAINTHINEKPSLLHDEGYLNNVNSLRSGDVMGYIALDRILTALLPMIEAQANKLKRDFPKQMKQQRSALPSGAMDPAKIVVAEIDMGMWLLKQVRSYAISMGINNDGVWFSDSIKFKPNSPVLDFLNMRSSGMEIIDYLPSDVVMAGGMTMHAPTIERLNSIMMDLFLPAMNGSMTEDQVTALKNRYAAITNDVLAAFGSEVAFAITTKSDKMMPRVVYVFEVADEEKARNTVGNLKYIMEMAQPFYDAFGMEIHLSEGPTQRYTGVQIKSFQMDFSKIAELVPNGAAVYPDMEFLWHAFVDDKMVFAMSQSADTIKNAIDAIKGRTSCITNSPGFEDIDIRLPERSNMLVYVSPTGYLGFVMNMMMSQMGKRAPSGRAMRSIKPNMGLAISTRLDGDGVSNFGYFLAKEIQELVSTASGFSQMMKPK